MLSICIDIAREALSENGLQSGIESETIEIVLIEIGSTFERFVILVGAEGLGKKLQNLDE